MRSEDGQASVEWIGLILLVSVGLGGLAMFVAPVDGRSVGGFLAHRIVCAARRGCDDGDAALASAYGRRDAALVRAYAPSLVYEHGEPSLPVDYRRCREHACADTPDDHDLDTHRSSAGQPATVFTRRLRRHGRLYIAYWLYYPDSNTAVLGSDKVWNHSPLRLARGYPGFHRDDWEAAVIRIDPDGSVWARASSHSHWQGCKRFACRGRWVRSSGWTRVSRGSHAGHIPGELRPPLPVPPSRWPMRRKRRRARFQPIFPGIEVRERTSTAEGLRLVALETLDQPAYRPLDNDVQPPWQKGSWSDLEKGQP